MSNKQTSFPRVNQKFCNILVCASLGHVYLVTEAVQAVEGTCYSW